VQEALSNAIRHSGAKIVRLELAATQSIIALEITDNGRGFEPMALANNEGLGLVSIRERLRALDGSLTIDAKPSRGTRLEIVIPLPSVAK
jgi:signal transduction histidine kinase